MTKKTLNRDHFSSLESGEFEMGDGINQEYDIIKVPILEFIYYVYLESDKTSEELGQYFGSSKYFL